MSRNLKWAILVAAAIILIPIIGFVWWSATTSMPTQEAIAALKSDEDVKVEFSRIITFTPTKTEPKAGLIIYPGGHIDARAYAPVAKAIAKEGYLVKITAVTLTLAIISPNVADAAITEAPEIEDWAIGGHSLGGTVAAKYAKTHPDKVKGLILWGAYPDSADDLSQSGLPVVSVSATNDGLSTPEDIDAHRQYLPAGTKYVVIQGGNHAQFGAYGPQGGDGQATISPADQQKQVVDATVDLLSSITKK